MFVCVTHVGKSHLTARLLQSIPEAHKIVLVDGSFVQDCGTLAFNRPEQITYIPTGGVPHCLAKNWNLGAAAVPASEEAWLFCSNDVEFHPGAWNHIREEEERYPDCGIIKHQPLNWNLWLVRRWAWDLLQPMDERYVPCCGEDDDLNMKCAATKIPIRCADFRVVTLEGGHGSRIDMHRPGINSIRAIRPVVVGHFQRKWGIAPSARTDKRYSEAKKSVYVWGHRRKERPADGTYTIPTERGYYGKLPEMWPTPLRLHLGCGRQRLEGFLNVDGLEACKPDYLMDVVGEPWPWRDGSVERIEAYHLIEHLSRDDGRELILRSFAALESGGVLVLECPDFRKACERYLELPGRRIQHIHGNQKNAGQFHLWGYTADSLSATMKAAGFRIKHTGPGRDYHAEQEPCIRVEGVKP